MNDNRGATVLAFERPGRGGRDMRNIGGVVQAAISAAANLQSGAAGLLQQIETDKEILERVKLATGNLTGQVESLRATADEFLAALREETRKEG